CKEQMKNNLVCKENASNVFRKEREQYQGQKASDYDNSDPVPPRQNVAPSAEKTDSSQQELELLFHLHIAMLRTTGK
ncbi:hypothetical protein Tco_0460689, partial [Tanacetum coccineum]